MPIQRFRESLSRANGKERGETASFAGTYKQQKRELYSKFCPRHFALYRYFLASQRKYVFLSILQSLFASATAAAVLNAHDKKDIPIKNFWGAYWGVQLLKTKQWFNSFQFPFFLKPFLFQLLREDVVHDVNVNTKTPLYNTKSAFRR